MSEFDEAAVFEAAVELAADFPALDLVDLMAATAGEPVARVEG